MPSLRWITDLQITVITPNSMRFSQVLTASTCKGSGSNMSPCTGTGRKGGARAA